MAEKLRTRDTDRKPLDPPTFAPPPEMRTRYLRRRRDEVEEFLKSPEPGEWKTLLGRLNHVRGSGAMFGFAGIGGLAEELVRAIQNRDPDCRGLMTRYAKAVNEAYV